MKTAKEFLQERYKEEDNYYGDEFCYSLTINQMQHILEDYANIKARFHVTAALEEAAYNVELRRVKWTDDYEVDKRSILNAYPLTKIL